MKTKTLNIILWVAQALMCAFFLMAGLTKFTSTIAEQRQQMEWARHVSDGLIYFVGIVEILGAIGLILPALLKIMPLLTPVAAIGLAIDMILAIGLNLYIGQILAISLLLIVAILLFITWGRLKKVQI